MDTLSSEQIDALRVILKRYVDAGRSLPSIAESILAANHNASDSPEKYAKEKSRLTANMRNFLRNENGRTPNWKTTIEPLYKFAESTLRFLPVRDPVIKENLNKLFGNTLEIKPRLVLFEAINTLFGITEENLEKISREHAGYYRCYRYSSQKGRIVKSLLYISEYDDDNSLSHFKHWYVRDGADRLSRGIIFNLGNMLHFLGKIEPEVGLHYMSLHSPATGSLRGVVKFVTYLQQSVIGRVLCIHDPEIQGRADVELGVRPVDDFAKEITEYSSDFANLLDNYSPEETALNILAPQSRPDPNQH